MGRQRVVNSVFASNDAWFNGSGISTRFYIQYENDGKISRIGSSKITTRNFDVSSNISTKHDNEIDYNSTTVINSHANTNFFLN